MSHTLACNRARPRRIRRAMPFRAAVLFEACSFLVQELAQTTTHRNAAHRYMWIYRFEDCPQWFTAARWMHRNGRQNTGNVAHRRPTVAGATQPPMPGAYKTLDHVCSNYTGCRPARFRWCADQRGTTVMPPRWGRCLGKFLERESCMLRTTRRSEGIARRIRLGARAVTRQRMAHPTTVAEAAGDDVRRVDTVIGEIDLTMSSVNAMSPVPQPPPLHSGATKIAPFFDSLCSPNKP